MAQRKIKDQRNDQRHRRSVVLHFRSHSELLFPAAEGRHAAVGGKTRKAVSMESSRQKIARSHNGDCTLVIMAKAPRPGVVKTRLAQSLPSPAVIELYRCLLNDTMALARSLDGVEVAIMCPASDVEDLSRAAGDAMRVVAQIGSGLAAGPPSGFADFAGSCRPPCVPVHND